MKSSQLKGLKKEKRKLAKKVILIHKEVEKQHIQEKLNLDNLKSTENSYKKNQVGRYLSFNQNSELKKTTSQSNKDNIENNLLKLSDDLSKAKMELAKISQEISKKRKELKIQKGTQETNKSTNLENNSNKTVRSNKRKKKNRRLSRVNISPSSISNINNTITAFDAEWQNVFFGDGYITIKFKDHWYRKDIIQSKKFVNDIKHYYTFHNVPKLRVILEGLTIKTIENQEVLFYHIDFLSVTALSFGIVKLEPFQINKWKIYTKYYYKIYLPFLFHTDTLKRLSEYCDTNLQIIPIGERVINSNGFQVIRNSYLFPMKSKVGVYLIWESVEEATASYVFHLSFFDNENIQNIFDYIAGDTINKRSTLVNSKSLQAKLKMAKRILHTDLASWDFEVRHFCKIDRR